MSYLSTSGNVGFSGLSQNLSDASCATQYKMAVEGVCNNDVSSYAEDGLIDEQTYIPHNEYYHTKFKIDPNELYTFHDSDVIASEITVTNTEENYDYSDSVEFRKSETESDVRDALDCTEEMSNGISDQKYLKEVIPNGHYESTKTISFSPSNREHTTDNTESDHQNNIGNDFVNNTENYVDFNTVLDLKVPININNKLVPNDTKTSINSIQNNDDKVTNNKTSETFLDVFKREQIDLATSKEPVTVVPAKTPAPRKSSGSKSSSSKPRRGRGPAVHEALQRISPSERGVVVERIRPWHAPGDDLFECGPLSDRQHKSFHLKDISSDEEDLPNIGMQLRCPEEACMESRGQWLDNRRASLRRQLAQATVSSRLSGTYQTHRALLAGLKKQLSKKSSLGQLPPPVINHALAMRGLNSTLSSRERKRLRETGWSGGESISNGNKFSQSCSEEPCDKPPLPCSQYCLSHVTMAPEQRLYASCSAVFAGGARCKQPLLPLQDLTPLCAEHAWKRDNYDKISRECKPKKVIRKRVCPPNPRRAKRRRRPPTKPRPFPVVANNTPTLSDINVCSNSSTYDSSEDAGIGAVSETEYIVTSTNTRNLEVAEVGQVPPDDILDPAVLGQIPDEAFTEFFNQSEGSSAFVESEELTRALEAVLDERALDTIADCVFSPPQHAARSKISVPATVSVEMSGAPS